MLRPARYVNRHITKCSVCDLMIAKGECISSLAFNRVAHKHCEALGLTLFDEKGHSIERRSV